MLGELCSGNCRVEAHLGAIKDRAPVEDGAARVLPEVNQIVRRALDAEPSRALVQAEMQGQARPVVLNQSRPKPRNLGPLGGQHLGMKFASETGRLAFPASSSTSQAEEFSAAPGNGPNPVRRTRGRAMISGLTRLQHRREANFEGRAASLRRFRRGGQASPPPPSASSRRRAPFSPSRSSGVRLPCRL